MPDMDSVWSDMEYRRALAHLDTLQQQVLQHCITSKIELLTDTCDQINDLRASLPSAINSFAALTSPSNGWPCSPSYIYNTFTTNVLQAADGVKQVRDGWETDYAKHLLDKVQASIAQDGHVQTQNWSLFGKPSSFDIKIEQHEDGSDGDSGVEITQDSKQEIETAEEDIEGIISTFRQLDVEIEQPNSGIIKVSTKAMDRPDYLRFTIRRFTPENDIDWHFRAMIVFGAGEKVKQSINRCLESRPGRKNLQSTLVSLPVRIMLICLTRMSGNPCCL